MKLFEVYKNANGNGYRHIGSADSFGKALIIIAQYSSNNPLSKLHGGEYYDSKTETLYKVK